MDFQTTTAHSQRLLSHALRCLYFTSQWRAATCAAGKTKSSMAASWWYSKQLPRESYADLPAPADLASIDRHSNSDLYVGMLVTNHRSPFSVLPPGPSRKPNSPITNPPAPRFRRRYDLPHQEARNYFPSWEDRKAHLTVTRNSNNSAISSRSMGNIFVYMSGGCYAA